MTIKVKYIRTGQDLKIDRLRNNMPGYILGEKTALATDQEILMICELKDKLAELHNRVVFRK